MHFQDHIQLNIVYDKLNVYILLTNQDSCRATSIKLFCSAHRSDRPYMYILEKQNKI